jgi:hypothetical protein
MKCKNCEANIPDGGKYCPVCHEGKHNFQFRCPYCDSLMILGQAKLHTTFGGFLLVGLSWDHLFFEEDNREEIRILKAKSQKEAYFCRNCEGLFIPA